MLTTAGCRANCEWPGKIISSYAGIGIAMGTLIETATRATIRPSDSEPIASEAATALISRDETAGAERPLKPTGRTTVRRTRIMAKNSSRRGRITCTKKFSQGSQALLGRRLPK